MLRVAIPVLVTFGLAASLEAAGRGEVSVRELMVPQKAKDKYADAQRRLQKSDVDGGRKRLREAVAMAPEYSAAWNALGAIATDTSEAEAHFRRAIECDPENLEAVLNLGALLLKTGHADAALEWSELGAREASGDASAQALLGVNLYQLGRLDKAEKALLQAKRLDARERSMPQLFLAEIYARRGEKARAMEEIEELLAQQLDPTIEKTLRAAAARLR